MSKFFTRSALVQQLVPNPSEGKVRALFGTGKLASKSFNTKPGGSKFARNSMINTEIDEIAEFKPVQVNEV